MVYHGGYTPVENPEIRVQKIRRILEKDFIAQLLKSKHNGGQNDMIQKLCLSMMYEIGRASCRERVLIQV